jgi:osmoprotectant transport system substrate-binding protein
MIHRHRVTAIARPLSRAIAGVLLAGLVLGVSGPHVRAQAPRREVVVASFDFVESVLLAHIYAAALRSAGIPVRLESRLGTRELVQPALRQGLIDVVPEYLGTALEATDPRADVDPHDASAVRARLAAALRRWHLQVLTPAPAQNQNVFVVSRADADRRAIHAVSDLAQFPRGVVVGGPAECPQRPHCLLGLRDVYGIRIRRFVRLEGQGQTLAALEQGVVDVAVLFTTDGALGDPGVVPLDDDRRLQPVENVVPVVSSRALERYGTVLSGALDAVSARLSSGTLRFLNWRTTIADNSPATEARSWLERQGLVPQPR